MAIVTARCQQQRELRRQQGFDLVSKFVLPNLQPNLSDHEQGLVLFSTANTLIIEGRHLIVNATKKRTDELKVGKAGCNDDDDEDMEMQIMVR
jgi:hypothetical protein